MKYGENFLCNTGRQGCIFERGLIQGSNPEKYVHVFFLKASPVCGLLAEFSPNLPEKGETNS